MLKAFQYVVLCNQPNYSVHSIEYQLVCAHPLAFASTSVFAFDVFTYLLLCKE